MDRWVLGVTGAVGAGKSTLCRILRAHGWSVLDLDDVAADALSQVPPAFWSRVPCVITAEGAAKGAAEGTTERTINKARIFAAMLRDPELRRELEQQLRPGVLHRTQEWIRALRGPGAVDAALLFESGLDKLCDATLCVRCARDERRRRVQQRTTASALHFDALDAAQWPEAEKAAHAGASVSSEGTQEQLEQGLRGALRSFGREL